MASFFVIRGPDHGQHFAIRGPVTAIGRDSSNQVRLNDSEVSRHHAVVARTPEAEFELRDCDSSNGTFVNSRPVQSTVLHSGDRVQVGRSLMIFTSGPEARPRQAIDAVEIVSHDANELESIRDRVESQRLSGQSVLAAARQPSDSPLSTGSATLAGLDDGEIIYQVSQAIHRTIDTTELLRTVLDLIFQWVNCDRGCIMLLDDVCGEPTPACSRMRGGSRGSEARPLQISRTILDHVMKNQEGVLTSNAQTDERWESVASIAGLGIREAICVPMQGRYGLLGAIYVDTELSAGAYAQRQRPCFDQSHLKLMIAIAGQAALAIEDTQFYHAMLQAERLAAMGQTIANVSHHVKNILQGISGGNYLVEEGLGSRNFDALQRGWSIVRKNQERISSLVLDMLTFSKDRQPELQLADVGQVVSEVVELMRNRAAEAGVQLRLQLPEHPTMAMMDGEAIHRAVLNVVTNAIDAVAAAEEDQRAAPGRVEVAVSWDGDGQRVQISVADNGPGIPAEMMGRIFAPFQSSKGSRGTGLGLPVSQKILREHGGDISVQSEVGGGTCFTLYWPTGASERSTQA